MCTPHFLDKGIIMSDIRIATASPKQITPCKDCPGKAETTPKENRQGR